MSSAANQIHQTIEASLRKYLAPGPATQIASELTANILDTVVQLLTDTLLGHTPAEPQAVPIPEAKAEAAAPSAPTPTPPPEAAAPAAPALAEPLRLRPTAHRLHAPQGRRTAPTINLIISPKSPEGDITPLLVDEQTHSRNYLGFVQRARHAEARRGAKSPRLGDAQVLEACARGFSLDMVKLHAWEDAHIAAQTPKARTRGPTIARQTNGNGTGTGRLHPNALV